MVGRRLYIALFLIMCMLQSVAQHVFTQVKLNKSKVYVGEPVEITFSVYTSTWFTSGVDIGNVQVNDAFSVYFRSVSTSKSINGKTYAGVDFIYNIFPYSEDDIVFPELNIQIESPAEGDYKGKKRTVTSKARTIKVRPIPPDFDKSQWLVTTNLTVNDRWQGDLKNVKVGDVLVRTINRTATGTVSELIPPVIWPFDSLYSLYPERPLTENNKSKTSISANRTDAVRYLFEQEGDITIPEITMYWWNATRKQIYKRTLKERIITVKPNPDLGMLTSIKDSLEAIYAEQDATNTPPEERVPFSFLGLNWWQLTGVLLALIFIMPYIYRILKRSVLSYRKRREEYLLSERHYFALFIKNLHRSEHERMNAFYRWVDCLPIAEPTWQYHKELYRVEQSSFPIDRTFWRTLRQSILQGPQDSSANWINP